MSEGISKKTSVIICSHSPRIEYLKRVLSALTAQTYAHSNWELLIIDNASTEKISEISELRFPANTRHVREEKLGLTHARLRGIIESTGDLIVFVDDDNVLDQDYLLEANRISALHPHIGAWGGEIVPDFEVQPAKHLLPWMAIREVRKERWSNWSMKDLPMGAGLCIRRSVALEYLRLCSTDPVRMNFGTKAGTYFRCEDTDMAYCAYDIGYGLGVFPGLRLTHLIPSQRVQEEYVLKLVEGLSFSNEILSYLRGVPFNPTLKTTLWRLYDWVRFDRYPPPEVRRFSEAHRRGQLSAMRLLKSFPKKNHS